MLRQPQNLLKISSLLFQSRYNCYIPHLLTTHYAQQTMRATRRYFLNKQVLNQSKDVIYAEKRQPTDLVLKLKQQGKCPGVIRMLSRKKEEEVDIILDGKTMKNKMNSISYGLDKVFVRVEGKQYCAVLRQVRINPHKKFIQKVFFNQYVPGQPNYLTIPIAITHLEQNRFYHEGMQIDTPTENVDIICYNQEYPTKFQIDISYVNLDRPYTLGDLANTFPPGIILRPGEKTDKVLFLVKEPEGVNLIETGQMEEVMAKLKASRQSKAGQPSANTGSPNKVPTPEAKKGK